MSSSSLSTSSTLSNGKLIGYLTIITIVLYFLHGMIFKHLIIEVMLKEAKGKGYVLHRVDRSTVNALKVLIEKVPVETINIDKIHVPLRLIPNTNNEHINAFYHFVLNKDNFYILDLEQTHWQSKHSNHQQPSGVTALFDRNVFYPYEIKSYHTLRYDLSQQYNDCVLLVYSGKCRLYVDKHSGFSLFFTVNELAPLFSKLAVKQVE